MLRLIRQQKFRLCLYGTETKNEIHQTQIISNVRNDEATTFSFRNVSLNIFSTTYQTRTDKASYVRKGSSASPLFKFLPTSADPATS